MLLILFTVLVITAVALLYKLLLAPEKDFWSKYGIRQIDTSKVLGPFDKLLGLKPMTDVDDFAYAKLRQSEKFCGILENGVPLLLVKDLNLVKQVLIKDFDHFTDRRPFFSQEDGVLKLMLPNLEGEQWKGVRSAVSPAFSTGKIRKVMEIFNSIGAEWAKHLLPKSNNDSVVIDVLKSVTDYNIDVISTAIFGMKADAIQNPQSTFCRMAHQATNFPSILSLIKFALKLMLPGFCRLFKISGVNKPALDYFQQVLRQGLELRMNGKGTHRNDLLQTLADARKEQDNNIMKDGGNQRQWLTDEVLNAQCIVFFLGGFGTTSHLITFIMYALALHPEIQDKLRDEIKSVVKDDGNFEYDDISRLNYLDMVLCESLRKFPVGGGRIERLCVRDYKLPEMGLFVPKGAIIDIPVNSIHHSNEHYQNPDLFDPEHFSAENKASRNPYAFLPFGLGPRQCIGLRFAQVQMKSAIAHIVNKFFIESTPKTPITLQGAPVAFGLAPPKNLELKLTPI